MQNLRVIKVRLKKQFSVGYKGKKYSFLTYLKDLKIGDKVVVATKFGYKVAKVVDFMSLDEFENLSEFPTSFAFQKVDESLNKGSIIAFNAYKKYKKMVGEV